MKTKLQRLLFAGLLLSLAASCTTAYDEYGRPIQVVEPEAAVIGAAAAGLLAYGLAESHDHNRSYNYNRPYYHNQPHYSYRPPHPRPPGPHPSYRSGPHGHR